MKNILLILVLIIGFSSYSFAQEQKKLFELRILKFINNGIDQTDWIAQRKQSLIFYEKGGEDFMANYCNSCTDETQSYGRVYNFTEIESGEETAEKYAYSLFTFTWRYFNTYDNRSGSADARLLIIRKPRGATFTLKLILSNMDVLEYEGYVEESLN